MNSKTKLLVLGATLAAFLAVWWFYFRSECNPHFTITTEQGTYACVDGKLAKQ